MTLPTEEVVYRVVDQFELTAYLVRPEQTKGLRPAVVFFHGGRWRTGHPFSFLPHCHYFASRGMVAASAQYRLIEKDARDLDDCVDDARAAVQWLRGVDGVDPSRMVAAGYSSGGHLAASTAFPSGVAETRPDALVLLNPVTQVVRSSDHAVVQAISPVANVCPGAPPTLITYGTRDFLRPMIMRFADAVRAAGNRCDMVALDGAHTVVHPPVRKRDDYVRAVTPIDDFLVSLGFIEGSISVDATVDALDTYAILGGRSENVDPRKTRAKKSRPGSG